MTQIKDFLNQTTLSQLSVSPDGRCVAFVVRSAETGTKSLWLYDFQTEECYKLLEGSQFLGCFYWEDAEHLFYLARGMGKNTWCRRYYVETLVDDEICIIPSSAREVWQVGERYVFRKEQEEGQAVQSGLYAMSVHGGKIIQLTPEGVAVEQAVQCPEGLFCLTRTGDRAEPGICFLSKDGEMMERVVEEGEYPITHLAADMDPLTGTARVSFVAEHHFYTVEEGEVVLLPIPADTVADTVCGAFRYGTHNDFCMHQGGFAYIAAEQTSTVVKQADFSGHTALCTPECGKVDGFAYLPDGSLCFAGYRNTELPELYLVKKGQLCRLTHLNEGRLDARK